jgi:serine O-acetyltransferase
MQLEIPKHDLLELLKKQLGNFFPLSKSDHLVLEESMSIVLDRAEYCFSKTTNRYYSKNGSPYFNPFHSGQYSIFLYYFSNTVYKTNYERKNLLADKIYYLNKAMNSLDLFYEVELPKVFFTDHAVGSVLARATYGEYFSFSQNCTVGNNKGVYPVLGENVVVGPGSMILGKCSIGSHVIVAANSFVKDTDIPSYSLVFGQHPNVVIRARTEIK